MILDRRLPSAVTLGPRSSKLASSALSSGRTPCTAEAADRAEHDSMVVAAGQQRRPGRRARLHRAEGTHHSETRPVPTRQNSRFWMCPTSRTIIVRGVPNWAVRVRPGVAVCDGGVIWAASPGRCYCRAKLRQLGVPLPGGACDVGGDDVGRVPVQAAAGGARVFDAATGAEISRLDHDSQVTAVAFRPDGTRVATGSSDRSARVWCADHGQLIEQAVGRLTRNLTQQEWRRYFRDVPYRKTRADPP